MIVDLWDRAEDEPNDCTARIENPSEAERLDHAAVIHALNEEANREASPGPDKVFGSFPKEDGETTANKTCDTAGQYKEAAKCLARRIDGLQDTEAKDERETDDGKRVESDNEEGRPSVLVAPECAR